MKHPCDCNPGVAATALSSSARRLRILLADAHPPFRDQVRAILLEHPQFELVAEAGDGEVAMELVRRVQPDMVLIDTELPRLDGLRALRELRELSPPVRVLALAEQGNPEYALRLVHAGAVGYLQKDACASDLLTALRTASESEPFFSPGVAGAVLKVMIERTEGSVPQEVETLSARERQVLAMLAAGRANKEIAVELKLSVRTVETYRDRLRTKLKLHTVRDLTRYAMSNGLVPKAT